MIATRPARPDDLSVIADLYQAAFPEALSAVFGKPRIPARAVEDVYKMIYDFDPEGLIVACDEGRPVGFISVVADRHRLARRLLFGGALTLALRWLRGRYRGLGFSFVGRLARAAWQYRASEIPAQGDSATAQILSIVVSPRAQRMGVGSQLTQAALAYLARKGIRQVRLEVDSSKSGAIALYTKFGFVEHGRMPSPRGEALIMVKTH